MQPYPPPEDPNAPGQPGQYGPPPGGYGQPPAYGPPGYNPAQGYGPMGYPPPPQFQRAMRPGCVPVRPLGVGDILDGAFTVIRRNPRATLGLSAAVAVITTLVTATFQILVSQSSNSFDSDNATFGDAVRDFWGAGLVALLALVITLVGATVLTGMLTLVVTEDVLGTRLPLGVAWHRIRPRLWPLIGLSLVVGILETLGLIPCLTVGIWLWGIWAVAVPAFVVGGTTIRGALSRSKLLVNGTFWRVWGVRALGYLLAYIISRIIALIFLVIALGVTGSANNGNVLSSGSGSGETVGFILIAAVGTVIATTITSPLKAGIDALLYVDLRMRKEGLDLVLQQAAYQRGTAHGSPR